MKLKTKRTTEMEFDIQIPFFRKNVSYGMTEYLAMRTEGFVITVTESDETMGIFVRPLWIKETEVVTAYNDWEPILEEQFLDFHQKTLECLSLMPVKINKLAADPNDLKDINI